MNAQNLNSTSGVVMSKIKSSFYFDNLRLDHLIIIIILIYLDINLSGKWNNVIMKC